MFTWLKKFDNRITSLSSEAQGAVLLGVIMTVLLIGFAC